MAEHGWNLRAEKDKLIMMFPRGGIRELIFDIRESFGRKDKLMIVNPHFLKICEFEYEIM